jgi:hypothetical protein
MATGPSLFDSGIQSLPGDNVFHQVTFNTPSLSLAAGNYVLFASTSQDQGGAPPSACQWGAVTNNSTYPFGQFVFENNGTDTTQWTLTNWSTIAEDLAFQANFAGGAGPGGTPTGVPALSDWGMVLLAGLLGAAGYFLLRTRQGLAPR